MSFSLRNPYSIYYLTAMKTNFFLLCLLLAISANAQIVYHDASAFPLLGKATETTLTRYERLPDSLRNISRKPLWELGRNSAGLAVRFRSNSTRIAAKWEVLLNRNMNHMTPTGIKGLDLYCLQDGKWLFAGSGRPQGKVNEATIVKDMLPEEREYLLFLSLYDGVTSLSIGILFAPAITFRLNGTYWNKDQKYSGEYTPDSFHIPRPINSIESAAPKPVCAVTACECHRFMEA